MGILGLPAGYTIFNVWSWYDSRKGKTSRLDKLDVSVKESRNRYRENNRVLAIPAKSEILNFVYENKKLVTKLEINLQTNHCFEENEIEWATVNRAPEEETLPSFKEAEFIEEKSQLKSELLESTRKFQETKVKMLMEIERLSRKETEQAPRKVVKRAEPEAVMVRNNLEIKTTNITGQPSILNEIETNLRIANTPWDGKPLPFQTKFGDTKMTEFDSLDTEHSEDLKEAYVDMVMANDIVWFCTEIGHASDDLELSYKQLCAKINERLATVYEKRHATCYT